MRNHRYKRVLALVLAAAALLICLAGCNLPGGGKSSAKPPVGPVGTKRTDSGTAVLMRDDGTAVTATGDAAYTSTSRDQNWMIMEDEDGRLTLVDKNGEKTVIEQEKGDYRSIRNDGLIYFVHEEREKDWTIEDVIECVLEDGDYTDTVEEAIAIMIDWGYENSVDGAKEFYEYLLGEAFDDVYTTTEDVRHGYRYTIPGGEKVDFGIVVDYIVNRRTSSTLYLNEDNEIWVLRSGETAPEKITAIRSDADVELIDVSPDGQIGFWLEESMDPDTYDSIYNVYCFEGTSTERVVKDYVADYISCNVMFTDDSKKAVLAAYNGEQLVLKKAGEECVTVRLNGTLGDYDVYSSADILYDDVNGSWDDLYVLVSADSSDDYNTLYHVNWDGERTKVISKVSACYIKQGNLYYMNESDSLYVAKLNGAEAGEPEKIASDVYSFCVAYGGTAVAYLRSYDSNRETGTLFLKIAGTDDPIKISSEAGYHYYICADGKSVLYFEDCTENSASYCEYGDLRLFTPTKDDGERATIATDVVLYGLYDGYNSYDTTYIDADGFFYVKFDYANSDDDAIGILYYYNGKESTKLVSDVYA